ncbi:MAG: ATP-grasp domain-containing protein [Candidatus Sericytochromatia bacterium]
MNVVMLSPHFPAQMTEYAHRLSQQGVTVIGLGDEPPQQLSVQLRAALDDYVYVRDMHQYDELLRACGQITWRHGKIDRIDSLNEYWLQTEAALRTDFNVPGIHNGQIHQIKAKSAMKDIFRACGIDCVPGRVANTPVAALAAAQELGYPVVIKPDIGVGAAHTYRANSPAELEAILPTMPQENWILEPFVDGQIFTFDGLTDRSGKAVFTAAMTYSQGVMEAVTANDHIYFYTLREIPADLEAAGLALVKGFDVRERFFHFEFFRRPDGSLLGLEVNMRPPGGPSIDLFNFAHDLDLYKEWAQIVAHNYFGSHVQRNYHAAYVGRKYSKSYHHDHATLCEALGPMLLEHGQLPFVFRQAMGDEYYLLRSPSESDIHAAAALIQAHD